MLCRDAAGEGKADLEVRHHLSSLLAQVGIAAFQPLQLGFRHLQLAPEGVHLHMGCCQLLPCAPLNPQGTSNRKPSIGTSVMNTKTNSCQMAGLGKFQKAPVRGHRVARVQVQAGGSAIKKVQLQVLFSQNYSDTICYAIAAVRC